MKVSAEVMFPPALSPTSATRAGSAPMPPALAMAHCIAV
jgi:hypothetical protein